MAEKSKLWKFGDSYYRVHIRKGLMIRLEKLIKEEPANYYYNKGKVVAADYNVPCGLKEKVNAFIKENKLK